MRTIRSHVGGLLGQEWKGGSCESGWGRVARELLN
jgi:hypothetical protein